MPDEIEAYRPHWDSAFRGHAIIRVGRFEDGGLVLRYLYRPRRFAEAQRGRFALMLAGWTQMNDALIAAHFWTLAPYELPGGCDGATWKIEGRREDTYQVISRWCPGGALWELGRLVFDFAGLDEVRV
jgi:hypothetical protein